MQREPSSHNKKAERLAVPDRAVPPPRIHFKGPIPEEDPGILHGKLVETAAGLLDISRCLAQDHLGSPLSTLDGSPHTGNGSSLEMPTPRRALVPRICKPVFFSCKFSFVSDDRKEKLLRLPRYYFGLEVFLVEQAVASWSEQSTSTTN
jgi:hypothetical protein